MKTFAQFVSSASNENIMPSDPSDVRKEYTRLKNKSNLDDMERMKLHALSQHPDVVKSMSEMFVLDMSGKKIPVKKVPVRMASGKIEMQYPGKSGSSGGGD